MKDNIDSILGDIESSDDNFIEDIRKYWRIITSFDDFAEVISAPLRSLKAKHTEVPAEEWDKLIKDFNVPAMEGDHVNLIMEHFTHEELKGIIALYEENPLLKKAVSKNNVIREDSYKLTVKWFNRFNDLVQGRLGEWDEMGYL